MARSLIWKQKTLNNSGQLFRAGLFVFSYENPKRRNCARTPKPRGISNSLGNRARVLECGRCCAALDIKSTPPISEPRRQFPLTPLPIFLHRLKRPVFSIVHHRLVRLTQTHNLIAAPTSVWKQLQIQPTTQGEFRISPTRHSNHHSITAAPQVNPAPNTTNKIKSPR